MSTNQDIEEWRVPLPEFPAYEVSNLGQIRSWYSINERREPSILGCGGVKGYKTLMLSNGKKRRSHQVHVLVAIAFCPGRSDENWLVRHFDGNCLNNRADNLIWGTSKENSDDALRHGTLSYGANHPGSKLTKEQVFDIFNDVTSTNEFLCEKFNISSSLVSGIRRRKKRAIELGPGPISGGAFGKDTRIIPKKLTAEDAIEIFLSTETDEVAGARFGIGAPMACRIRSRKHWSRVTQYLPDSARDERHQITKPPAVPRAEATFGLTPDALREIFVSPESGVAMSKKFGISSGSISVIRSGKTSSAFTAGLVAPAREFEQKLTPENAREVFAATGTLVEIGARYGITKQMVAHIKEKRWWKKATRSLWDQQPLPSAVG